MGIIVQAEFSRAQVNTFLGSVSLLLNADKIVRDDRIF